MPRQVPTANDKTESFTSAQPLTEAKPPIVVSVVVSGSAIQVYFNESQQLPTATKMTEQAEIPTKGHVMIANPPNRDLMGGQYSALISHLGVFPRAFASHEVESCCSAVQREAKQLVVVSQKDADGAQEQMAMFLRTPS